MFSELSVLRLNTGKTSSPSNNNHRLCDTLWQPSRESVPARLVVFCVRNCWLRNVSGGLCAKLLTSKRLLLLTKLQAMPKKWIRRVYRTKFCTNHSARNGKSGWVLLCAAFVLLCYLFFLERKHSKNKKEILQPTQQWKQKCTRTMFQRCWMIIV